MQDGADGIEFDVRLAADGVAVVIHDATLQRTGSVSGVVSKLSSEELGRVDVGSWFDRQTRDSTHRASRNFSSETLPTLQQVFDLFSRNEGLLYLEMKGEPEDGDRLAHQVVRQIQDNSLVNRVVVESFELSLIEIVKRIDPNVRTAALFEPKLSHPSSLVRTRLPQRAVACGADEIALHHTLSSAPTIRTARELGLNVVVWTVDNPDWVSKAQSLNIHALITNDPSKLVARLRETSV